MNSKYVLPVETIYDKVLNKLNYFVNLLEISQVYINGKNNKQSLEFLKKLIKDSRKAQKELAKLCKVENEKIEAEIKKFDSMITPFEVFLEDNNLEHIKNVLKKSDDYNKIIKNIIELCS